MNTADTITDLIRRISATDTIICSAALLLFTIWLIKTRFATKALTNSPPRRNNMPIYMFFIPLIIFFALAPAAALIFRKLFEDQPEHKLVFIDNLIVAVTACLSIIVIVALAGATFGGRLKGFGLDPKKIHKDIPAAFINLFTIFPFVTAAIILTDICGKFFLGPDFRINQHTELEILTTYEYLYIRIIIIINAVIIAPAFEEMLFRGLLQSVLRSSFFRPWPAVIASSAFFAFVHQQPAHWPALFVLAMCLGYSYEKSGSLFRPFFIHAAFNAIVIAATLTQQP